VVQSLRDNKATMLDRLKLASLKMEKSGNEKMYQLGEKIAKSIDDRTAKSASFEVDGNGLLISKQGGTDFQSWVNKHHTESNKIIDDKIKGVEASLASKGTGKNTNKNPRYQPGTVNQSFNLERSLQTQKQFMYNKGSIGVIPKEVRDQLIGKHFNSFDDFRKEFWKSVANSSFAEEFNSRNVTRMLEGNAPIAPKLEHYGKHKSYILHHKQPIDKGGEVYNLDNLIITSPKMHQNILDPAYHFGKKGH